MLSMRKQLYYLCVHASVCIFYYITFSALLGFSAARLLPGRSNSWCTSSFFSCSSPPLFCICGTSAPHHHKNTQHAISSLLLRNFCVLNQNVKYFCEQSTSYFPADFVLTSPPFSRLLSPPLFSSFAPLFFFSPVCFFNSFFFFAFPAAFLYPFSFPHHCNISHTRRHKLKNTRSVEKEKSSFSAVLSVSFLRGFGGAVFSSFLKCISPVSSFSSKDSKTKNFLQLSFPFFSSSTSSLASFYDFCSPFSSRNIFSVNSSILPRRRSRLRLSLCAAASSQHIDAPSACIAANRHKKRLQNFNIFSSSDSTNYFSSPNTHTDDADPHPHFPSQPSPSPSLLLPSSSLQNVDSYETYINSLLLPNPPCLQAYFKMLRESKKPAKNHSKKKKLEEAYDLFYEMRMKENAEKRNATFVDLSKPFLILAIETSCDDTACAVLNSEGKILSEKVIGQADLNVKYGGVKPDETADRHSAVLNDAIAHTLRSANISSMDEIGVLGITRGPGLCLCLKVAYDFLRQFLHKFKQKHIFFINHLEAHALTPFFFFKYFSINKFYQEKGWKYAGPRRASHASGESSASSPLPPSPLPPSPPSPSSPSPSPAIRLSTYFCNSTYSSLPSFSYFPFSSFHLSSARGWYAGTAFPPFPSPPCMNDAERYLVVLVSGGNSKIFLSFGIAKFLVLSETEDDALGEALDKIARSLGLTGGVALEKAAKNAKLKTSNFLVLKAGRKTGNLAQSYAGIKTAMQIKIEEEKKKFDGGVLPEESINEMAYTFQNVAFDHLLDRLETSMKISEEFFDVHSLALTGGVAANEELQRRVCDLAKRRGSRIARKKEFEKHKTKNLKILRKKINSLSLHFTDLSADRHSNLQEKHKGKEYERYVKKAECEENRLTENQQTDKHNEEKKNKKQTEKNKPQEKKEEEIQMLQKEKKETQEKNKLTQEKKDTINATKEEEKKKEKEEEKGKEEKKEKEKEEEKEKEKEKEKKEGLRDTQDELNMEQLVEDWRYSFGKIKINEKKNRDKMYLLNLRCLIKNLTFDEYERIIEKQNEKRKNEKGSKIEKENTQAKNKSISSESRQKQQIKIYTQEKEKNKQEEQEEKEEEEEEEKEKEVVQDDEEDEKQEEEEEKKKEEEMARKKKENDATYVKTEDTEKKKNIKKIKQKMVGKDEKQEEEEEEKEKEEKEKKEEEEGGGDSGVWRSWEVFIPPKRLCTDNAVMIAYNTLKKIFERNGLSDSLTGEDGKEIFVLPRWPLGPKIY